MIENIENAITEGEECLGRVLQCGGNQWRGSMGGSELYMQFVDWWWGDDIGKIKYRNAIGPNYIDNFQLILKT